VPAPDRGVKARLPRLRSGCLRTVGRHRAYLLGMDAVDSVTLELWGLERLLNINELAAYLRVPVSTIYEWRMKGQAPLAHRYGKHLTFAGFGRARVGRSAPGVGGPVTCRSEVTR
jgi:hypothetical protein